VKKNRREIGWSEKKKRARAVFHLRFGSPKGLRNERGRKHITKKVKIDLHFK